MLKLYLLLFWLNLGVFGLLLFLSRISGVLRLYLVLFWVNLGLFGFVIFFHEDFRCAEGMSDTNVIVFLAYVIFFCGFQVC